MAKTHKQRALTAKLHRGHRGKLPRGAGAILKAKKKQAASRDAASQSGKRPQQQRRQPGGGAKPVVPYSAADRILLLGEANFSFALALVAHFQSAHNHGRSAGGDTRATDVVSTQTASRKTAPQTTDTERRSDGGGATSEARATAFQSARLQRGQRADERGRGAPGSKSDTPVDSDDCPSDDEDECDGGAGVDGSGQPELCVVATTLDSRAVTFEKYPDAAANVRRLEAAGVAVLFGVDATKLQCSAPALRTAAGGGAAAFDKIVFNFPHVGLGIKDQDRNVLANRALLSAFFSSAAAVMGRQSEVHVTLKTGLPYELWAVKECARGCLAAATSFRFDPASYPGYSHRRTLGFREGLSAGGNEELARQECRTYVFRLPDAAAAATPPRSHKRRQKGRHVIEDDSEED